jgi:hypothetical protein
MLSTLQRLRHLRLRVLGTELDLTPLADLEGLERLSVTGSGELDLQPLTGRSGLRIEVGNHIEPVGARLLDLGNRVLTDTGL